MSMFRNYFKIALRDMQKHKSFAAINIAGLALGMACSLLILLWVQDEKSMDAFHRNGSRLYYVYERNVLDHTIESWYWTQGVLASEMKKQIPEVQQATPISWSRVNTFAARNKVLKEDGYSADADFFNMFSYPLLEGEANHALSTPSSIAISRQMATAFFGTPSAAIGQTIRYENKKDFTVTAVFEDLSSHVSDRFNYIINWQAYLEENAWAKEWGSVDPRTCILLQPGANPALVEKKIAHFLDKYPTEQNNTNNHIELGLQPFDQYYLHGRFTNGSPGGGRIAYVQLFSLVALFILLIACINFMNLSTARSFKRAREIGVRKVMGAARAALIRQFMGEAILVALLSAVLALIIVSLALPAFNGLADKQLTIPYRNIHFWTSLLAITLLTGIFSGSYPALALSSFQPIRVLKGTFSAGKNILWLRKGLVVFQFTLSIVLIIATLLISRQIHFVKTANLGYDKTNLLYIPVEGSLTTQLPLFTAEALRIPGITGISAMEEKPTSIDNGTLSVGWPGKEPGIQVRFMHEQVSPDFIQTMKLQMAAGRDFSPLFGMDTTALGCIVNETAIAKMGYKDPVGKAIFLGEGFQGHIIGVIKDFHFRSLHDPILPLILLPGKPTDFGTLLIRIQAGQTKAVLGRLEQLCKQLNPKFPFTYQFADQEYLRLYKSEDVVDRLSVMFAILAIAISCLGLLGLTIFTTAQRTREIGIRKVMGASIASLFALLSGDFLVLVGVAFLIAAPLGWWAMHEWLQGFAYKTTIQWLNFGLAGILAAIIALLTICFHTLTTASTNPVKSLRAE